MSALRIRFYELQRDRCEAERDVLWERTQLPEVRVSWETWGPALDDYYGAEQALVKAEKLLAAETSRACRP